jgi:hypothetical protein
MPKQHLVVETGSKELLNGESLRVILHPDSKRDAQPSSESYELKHIFVDGDIFWGSFGTIAHSVTLEQTAQQESQKDKGINSSIPCAYAYSNHYPFATIFSYLMNVTRFTETLAYEHIRFISKQTDQIIWEDHKENDFDAIKTCVEEGRKFKIALTDDQGVSVIHPVHTPEIYNQEKRLRVYTAYDAMPKILREQESLKKIGENLSKSHQNKNAENQDSLTYLSTPLIFSSSFYSTFYAIDCHEDGKFKAAIWDIYKNDFFQIKKTSLRVFAEK